MKRKHAPIPDDRWDQLDDDWNAHFYYHYLCNNGDSLHSHQRGAQSSSRHSGRAEVPFFRPNARSNASKRKDDQASQKSNKKRNHAIENERRELENRLLDNNRILRLAVTIWLLVLMSAQVCAGIYLLVHAVHSGTNVPWKIMASWLTFGLGELVAALLIVTYNLFPSAEGKKISKLTGQMNTMAKNTSMEG